MPVYHQPVLLNESIRLLDIKPGNIYIDATLGHAGHTTEILKLGGIVYGIDQDPQSLDIALKRIKKLKLDSNFHPINTNFSNISILKQQISSPISGILFDLGLNSSQITSLSRGFSFNDSQSLDMRLDQKSNNLTAEQIINTFSYFDLSNIFSKLAQEKLAKPIALKIIQERQKSPIRQADKLAKIVTDVYHQHHLKTKIHPATLVFLSLRIFVNNELNNLSIALQSTLNFDSGCRVVVISFNSGEDRLVKQFIRQNPVINLLPRPIRPSINEVKTNPLSRSSILRSYKII